jgi:hypothetical protein
MSKSGDDNWNPVCDISDPNDEVINGRDFGVFAMYWDGCGDPPPEPTMSYNIADCNIPEKMSWPDKDSVRFSVTCQGSYLLFADQMLANCCPGEVWLEMSVDGSQITITEFQEMDGCYCWCDYPTSATVGPFEAGDYTVEAIDVWSESLGTVPVTIE